VNGGWHRSTALTPVFIQWRGYQHVPRQWCPIGRASDRGVVCAHLGIVASQVCVLTDRHRCNGGTGRVSRCSDQQPRSHREPRVTFSRPRLSQNSSQHLLLFASVSSTWPRLGCCSHAQHALSTPIPIFSERKEVRVGVAWPRLLHGQCRRRTPTETLEDSRTIVSKGTVGLGIIASRRCRDLPENGYHCGQDLLGRYKGSSSLASHLSTASSLWRHRLFTFCGAKFVCVSPCCFLAAP
jgi:hypothetical protein